MRAVKSVSIDSERRVIITYLDGSTETLYPNCIWCDSEALRQLIKDLLEEKADAITQTIENVTIATFADGADEGLFKKLLVSIDLIQEGSGDPSPENVRPFSGRQGVNVYLAGKDIFSDLTIESGYYAADGTPAVSTSGQLVRCANYIPVSAGDIFTIRADFQPTTNARLRVHEYDSNQNWIRQIYATETLQSGVKSFSIPLSGDAKYVRFSLPIYNTLNVFTNSTDVNVDFGETVYGGTLDVVSGKLTVEWVKGYDIDSVSGNLTDLGNTLRVPIVTLGPYNAVVPSINSAYGNILKSRVSGYSRDEAGFYFYSANRGYLFFDKASLSSPDLNGINAILAQTPFYTVYKIAEPFEIQLTPQEITTLLGDNNIWADSGNIMELEYTADTKLYIGGQQSGTSGTLGSGRQPITTPDIQPVTDKTLEEISEEVKE